MNDIMVISITAISVSLIWNFIIVPMLNSRPKNGVFIRPKD